MSHHVSVENETHPIEKQSELLAAKPSLLAPFAVSNKRKRTGTAQKTSCEELLPFHAVLQWTAATFHPDSSNLKLSQVPQAGLSPTTLSPPERPITRSRLSQVSFKW